jgi:hypothetical protein
MEPLWNRGLARRRRRLPPSRVVAGTGEAEVEAIAAMVNISCHPVAGCVVGLVKGVKSKSVAHLPWAECASGGRMGSCHWHT